MRDRTPSDVAFDLVQACPPDQLLDLAHTLLIPRKVDAACRRLAAEAAVLAFVRYIETRKDA